MKVMFLINRKNKDMKKHLQSIIAIAQNIIDKSDKHGDFLHPIYRYINALGYSVLQRLLMQLFTGKEVDNVDVLFYDLCHYINSENYISDCTSIENNEKISISLKDNLVIPVAWNISRFETNIAGIGADCGNQFEFQKLNHMSKLFLPIGVTIVHNGNHSILSGIIKREGVIHPTEIVNLTSLYEKIKFDGVYYRDVNSNQVIQEVKNFELGAIYEIGRLLIKNDIKFLEQSDY
jgi:hypothetical protein